ncbi:MAG TPA: hypothetical protein PLS07_00175 [Niabella sp.]|nr:hypothetical protein [Niabella sp.]HQW14378.1 hypothetical protein [Niabella sp.]HQX18343.1 hypothetical protein [Niabella sp.]HQX40165.1 hypothetical protein [Niabella sp.]HRB05868.1 hypothetical protein [Niabella sp.]
MLHSFFKGWDIIRIIRLILGVAIIAQGARSGQWSLLLVGILFAAMPIFNIGCCAGGNCAVPPSKSNRSNSKKDISYEEIK